MIYFVTRHAGALSWLQQHVKEPAIHIGHLLDFDDIAAGDVVMGTLPVHMVASVCRRGARYFHLEMTLPSGLRGQELTVSQMTALGATLVEYFVYAPCPDEHIQALSRKQEGA